MENDADLKPTAEEAAEMIAKKVYDDMEAAYQSKLAEQEKAIKTLNKQVDDYSRILRNINVIETAKPKQSSSDMVKNILGGIR